LISQTVCDLITIGGANPYFTRKKVKALNKAPFVSVIKNSVILRI
jgi:hypothetical protein